MFLSDKYTRTPSIECETTSGRFSCDLIASFISSLSLYILIADYFTFINEVASPCYLQMNIEFEEENELTSHSRCD
jgi:hypothetical protein